MTDRKKLKIKSGGQWLISPVNDTKVFCRETFTEDQQDIDAMVQEFARDRILPNAEAIDKLDKELEKSCNHYRDWYGHPWKINLAEKSSITT